MTDKLLGFDNSGSKDQPEKHIGQVPEGSRQGLCKWKLKWFFTRSQYEYCNLGMGWQRAGVGILSGISFVSVFIITIRPCSI